MNQQKTKLLNQLLKQYKKQKIQESYNMSAWQDGKKAWKNIARKVYKYKTEKEWDSFIKAFIEGVREAAGDEYADNFSGI